MSSTPITDNDLHAFVDRELDPARRAAVEAHIAANAEAAAAVAAYRLQRVALHSEFDPALNEPLPGRMVRRYRYAWADRLMPIAAALAIFLVSGAGGWYLRDFIQPMPASAVAEVFPERARVAHAVYVPERRHAVEVQAHEPHLVPWLTNRLGTQVVLPDLAPLGFRLVGGRLIPGERSPAAQFLYQDPDGRRVTLYMRHGDTGGGDTVFSFASSNDAAVYYWIKGATGYAVVGGIERDELLSLAKLVYKQVSH
jgi:anti-sigma factor RsiW